MKLVLIAMAGLFTLCVCAGVVGGGGNKTGGSSTGTASAMVAPAQAATQKNEQLPWIETVQSNCTAYKAAPNEIKKSAVYNQNEALLAKTKVANVKGKLSGLKTSQGGNELSLRIRVDEVEFHTESLFDTNEAAGRGNLPTRTGGPFTS